MVSELSVVVVVVPGSRRKMCSSIEVWGSGLENVHVHVFGFKTVARLFNVACFRVGQRS